MRQTTKTLAIGTLSALLCACSGFFDKDNTPAPTPLTNFPSEARAHLLWNSSVNAGVGGDYLKLIPAVNESTIFTADKNGVVTASDKITGRTLWKKSTQTLLSAGPAADSHLVFLGSRKGTVLALSQTNGASLWRTQISSEILAPPAAANGVVLIKSTDGRLTALSESTGRILWHYQQSEPALILRGGSAPQINHNTTVAGFANGRLAKLTLKDGSLLWQQTVAMPEGSFAIQRMVDINADPIIYKNRIYVATYQGKIAALDLTSGREMWSNKISSFTGLAADNTRVYVSDATSHLWAFDAETGAVDWRQPQLEARNITGPNTMDNYVVVGDAEGYLHWLSKQDGHFTARTRTNGNGILATPVVDNHVVYTLTMDGYLSAYTLR